MGSPHHAESTGGDSPGRRASDPVCGMQVRPGPDTPSHTHEGGTFFFGWAIGMVGCYMGLSTSGGTVGVGQATTRAVVAASITVFVSDFFLTKVIMML